MYKIWDKFAAWYWPHFLRNNLLVAVAVIILIIVAKASG